MKVVTEIQPYATLIALEEKGIETRSWYTKHRGMLAIHAGLKIDYEACGIPEIKRALERHGITDPSMLPTGCILCICSLFDCVKMVKPEDNSEETIMPGYKVSKKERAFGYYAPGRYGWVLAFVRRLSRPIKARGKQLLWDFDLSRTNFRGQEWD